MNDLSNLAGLFAFLGTAAFLGFFKSQVLEMLPQFQKLTINQKTFIVLAASVFFGLLSYGLTTYFPVALLTQLQPVYTVVFASVTVWLASQGYHKLAAPNQPTGK